MLESQLFYRLPYGARRIAHALLAPRRHRSLRLRRGIKDTAGYTFHPFDQHRCIFVHVPKAAGVSVCRSLFGNLAGGHTPVAEYQFAFARAEFDRYFKFTFVRNPWDRLFSAYTFLKKGGMNDKDRGWVEANLGPYRDFDEFVRRWVNPANVRRYVHFLPQHHFLCLPFAKEPAVDFVGYYENLAEDFAHVERRIFGRNTRTLPHQNKTGGGDGGAKADYREFYTDETRDIVADVYRRDVAMLGYRFDNSSLPSQLTTRRA